MELECGHDAHTAAYAKENSMNLFFLVVLMVLKKFKS